MSDGVNTPLRALLLDMDGTLLDSKQMDMCAMERLFNDELSLQLGEDKLRGFLGMTSEDVLHEVAPGREEYLLQLWLAIQNEFRHLVRLFPGVRLALEKQRAAGRVLGVVTAQSRRELAATRAHIDLEDLIEVWVSSDDTERPKPFPEPVHLALSGLSVAPAEAVMIGDTIFDLSAGRAAGVRVAAALYGAPDPQALLDFAPDYVLRQPEEIGKIGKGVTVTKEREITVTNDVGLHARPAAAFVKTAARFSAGVRLQNLTRESPAVNAKSILSVLSAGVEQNHRIRLMADGEDAGEALEALCALIESNFQQAGE